MRSPGGATAPFLPWEPLGAGAGLGRAKGLTTCVQGRGDQRTERGRRAEWGKGARG